MANEMINIPVSEYKELLRYSEQMRILKSYLKSERYVSDGDIRCILDIPKVKEEPLQTFDELLEGDENIFAIKDDE